MTRQLYIGIVFLINCFITQCPPYIILKPKPKYNPVILLTVVTLLDFIIFSIPQIFGIVPSAPKSILFGILPPFLWCCFFFDEPLWKRLLVPILIFIVSFGIDCLCVQYIRLILGGSYDDIRAQNEYFLVATALYNMLLLVAVTLWVLLWQRIVDKKKNKYILLYLMISTYQLILMSLFLVIRKNASAQIMWISLIFLLASLLITLIMYYFFRHIEKLAQTKAQILALSIEQEAIRECQSIEQQNIEKLKTLRGEFICEIQNTIKLLQAKPKDASLTKTFAQSEAILEKARQEFYSPLPVLNALFTVKSHRAQELGIVLTINCFHNARLNIDDIDLCSIAGNLVDNALEACSQSDNETKRVCANVTQKANYLILTVENTVDSDFMMPSPKQRTSKADPHNHGIGLTLVEQICKQYYGSFTLKPSSNNTICATAILHERTIQT